MSADDERIGVRRFSAQAGDEVADLLHLLVEVVIGDERFARGAKRGVAQRSGEQAARMRAASATFGSPWQSMAQRPSRSVMAVVCEKARIGRFSAIASASTSGLGSSREDRKNTSIIAM